MEQVDTLIKQLRKAGTDSRQPFKDELITLAAASEIREYIEHKAQGEILEVQWELEEVIDAVTPKKAPTPEPEPPEEAPEAVADAPEEPGEGKEGGLTQDDVTLVYDDPRGLMIHKSKTGDRWFVTQVDPRSGQPQTFELHPNEVEQLKTQLDGSPYWVLGSSG